MAFADSGDEPPSSGSRTTPRPVETIAITQGEAVRRITLLGQIVTAMYAPNGWLSAAGFSSIRRSRHPKLLQS